MPPDHSTSPGPLHVSDPDGVSGDALPAAAVDIRQSMFRGWVVTVACMLQYTASAPAHSFGVNAFLPSIVAEFGITLTSASWIWLCASFTSAVLVPFAGAALDNIGSRRMSIVVSPAFVLTLLVASHVNAAWQWACCVAALRFLGAECLILIAITTCQRWFVRKRGRATALLGLSRIPLLGMPTMTTLAVQARGWRGAYALLAAIATTLLAPAAALMRSDPRSVGLLPDGELTSPARASTTDVELEPVSTTIDGAAESPPLDAATLRSAASRPLFWCVVSLGLIVDLFFAGFNYHFLSIVPTLGEALQRSAPAQTTMSYFLPLSIATNAVEALLGLVVLDRLTVRSCVLLTAAAHVIHACVCASCLLVHTLSTLSLFALTYGATSGVCNACMKVILPNVFGTRALGRIGGVQRAATVTSTGAGPILWAASFEQRGTYHPAIVAASALLFAAGAVMLAVARCTLLRGRSAPARATYPDL